MVSFNSIVFNSFLRLLGDKGLSLFDVDFSFVDDLIEKMFIEVYQTDRHINRRTRKVKCKHCRNRHLRNALKSYRRHLIMFINGKPVDRLITVPLLLCDSCQSRHAVLPALVIIPYQAYSIPFILRVFNDRFRKKMKVAAILEKYQISKTTYYRWLDRYEEYFTVYRRYLDSCEMKDYAAEVAAAPMKFMSPVFHEVHAAILERCSEVTANYLDIAGRGADIPIFKCKRIHKT